MRNKADIEIDGNNNIVLANSNLTQNKIEVLAPENKLNQLLANKKLEEANKLFESMINGASAQHPMYPHWRYGFEITDGKPHITHVPNSAEAAAKYPLRFKINCSIKGMPIEYKNTNEILSQSYKKQMKIDINIFNIETWIGDILIEKQEAPKGMPGTIIPAPFPPPEPMKLFLKDDEWSLDYLEIAVAEIDGDWMTFGNVHQENSKYEVTFKINIKAGIGKFNIKIREKYTTDVEANYMINQFIVKSTKKKSLNLKMLKDDRILIVTENYTPDQTLPSDIEEYIDILGDILKIEKFYKVKFRLPSVGMCSNDLDKIDVLKLIMKGKAIEGTFDDIDIMLNKSGIKILIDQEEKNGAQSLRYSKKNEEIELFGAKIIFSEYDIYFDKVTIKDKQKFMRKYKLMDEEESVKVIFTPSSKDAKYKAVYKI